MGKLVVAKDDKQLIADIYGNNCAFICPACGQVYLVSRVLREAGGQPGKRTCPRCKGSTGCLIDDGTAVLEW